MDPVGGERMASTMIVYAAIKDFYLKHPTSDEMSEFTTLEVMTKIRITHFADRGKVRSDADSKVVEIDEAREILRMLVALGFTRKIDAEVGSRVQKRSQEKT